MSGKIYRFFLICTVLHISFVLVAPAATAVKWDALQRLDSLAERCEALADTKEVTGLRQLINPLKKAMVAVAADPVPAGAKAPDQVTILQADLKNLTEVLSDPDHQTDADLVALLAGIHPVVENLMEVAGMPHVHANDDPAAKPTQEIRP